MSLVSSHGRLAVGNRVHVVGHIGGRLVHRSSQDNGATWSDPTVIAEGSKAFPMQYGGLYAVGDTVYLLTAQGHMGPAAQHLDFRKSTDNGATWSRPVQITGDGQQIRRANIVASGDNVHVLGYQDLTNIVYYFRSIDGGANWDDGVVLEDPVAFIGVSWLAVEGTTLHAVYGKTIDGVPRAQYIRSTDNGDNWSDPVDISGDPPAGQARLRVAAADGRLLVVWEASIPEPPGYQIAGNRSSDGGDTWEGVETIHVGGPNHHTLVMVSGGGTHLAWLNGNPNDPGTPAGYRFSSDYGATWSDFEIAISTSEANLPHSIVADANWVHIIAEPGVGPYAAGTYARRPVAAAPPPPPPR